MFVQCSQCAAATHVPVFKGVSSGPTAGKFCLQQPAPPRKPVVQFTSINHPKNLLPGCSRDSRQELDPAAAFPSLNHRGAKRVESSELIKRRGVLSFTRRVFVPSAAWGGVRAERRSSSGATAPSSRGQRDEPPKTSVPRPRGAGTRSRGLVKPPFKEKTKKTKQKRRVTGDARSENKSKRFRQRDPQFFQNY